MALSSRHPASSDLIDNDPINWKQRYEKEKKDKIKVQKQMEQYKQKLKKLRFENEKTSKYCRKQIEIFKTKQTELLKHISSTHYSSTKQSLKYVFIEDIKQIKLNDGVRRNASIHITFANGEDSIFNKIDIIDPTKSNKTPTATATIQSSPRTSESSETSQTTKQNDHELQRILCNELEKRISDIDNLINITFGEKYMINDHLDDDDNINNDDHISLAMRLRLIEYVNEIKMRHNQYNLINRIQQNSTSLDDMKHAMNKQRSDHAQQLLLADKMNLQTLHQNNALWRNLLLNFPIDIVGILCFELNDRIHDVQNVKDVLYSNEEALYESMQDIMTDIKSRQKDSFRSWTKTDNTHSMSEKWDNIIGEVAVNNERWIKQIHFDPLPAAITAVTTPQKNGYTPHDENKSSWLFKDENRNEFLDSLQVNQHTVQLLTYIGAYLNRMIPTNTGHQELHSLYIPIVSSDPCNVLAACLDGVLFAILLKILDRDCIDLRVLQLPKKPSQPLSENQISDNLMVILRTIEGLNIQLPQWSVDDYFDPNHTVHIMLCIVFQVFYAMMDRQINLNAHPELIRLCQSDVEIQNAPYLSWKKWLNKWLLHLKDPQRMPLQTIKHQDAIVKKRDSILKRDAIAAAALVAEKEEDETDEEYRKQSALQESFESEAELIRHILHSIDYHDYIILICCRMNKDFLSQKMPQIQSHRNSLSQEDDPFTSKLLLECVVKMIGRSNSVVQMDDIASHNPLLQQLLICDLLRHKKTIAALSAAEKKLLSHDMVHMRSSEEDMFLGWLNCALNCHINNLEYALNDGVIVLKLLDELKRGCVDWGAVKLAHQIRHKFDRLMNCKLIMDVCCDHFHWFSLIGMNGSDIAEGNLKYILILLAHCMMHASTRLLSDIKFNGKEVNAKMILLWTNNRMKQYKKHNKVNIKSFHDSVLNDSILFLNLLSSIHKQWIDYKCVGQHSNGNKKNAYELRLANATYCITICRKLGAKIFCQAKQICNTDPKACQALIIAIMTIAAKHSDTDQLLLSMSNK